MTFLSLIIFRIYSVEDTFSNSVKRQQLFKFFNLKPLENSSVSHFTITICTVQIFSGISQFKESEFGIENARAVFQPCQLCSCYLTHTGAQYNFMDTSIPTIPEDLKRLQYLPTPAQLCQLNTIWYHKHFIRISLMIRPQYPVMSYLSGAVHQELSFIVAQFWFPHWSWTQGDPEGSN